MTLSAAAPGEVTQLLRRWGGGDGEALVRLMPMVYEELRALASAHLRLERPGHTLRTPDLVNEAYLRLVDVRQESWESRARFFSLASRIIRNILVDHARTRASAKRGSGMRPFSLDEAFYVTAEPMTEIVVLDDALTRLAAVHPQLAEIVELRYFGGLTNEEIAEVLDVSESTVARGWRTARAWLYRKLSEGTSP